MTTLLMNFFERSHNVAYCNQIHILILFLWQILYGLHNRVKERLDFDSGSELVLYFIVQEVKKMFFLKPEPELNPSFQEAFRTGTEPIEENEISSQDLYKNVGVSKFWCLFH